MILRPPTSVQLTEMIQHITLQKVVLIRAVRIFLPVALHDGDSIPVCIHRVDVYLSRWVLKLQKAWREQGNGIGLVRHARQVSPELLVREISEILIADAGRAKEGGGYVDGRVKL